ncbi:L-glutamyl-[BtrI acyl-carrier protein] decarboxylase [compost metagenome]|uniref:phosphopantetheine-binding protein n=1 Tax=Pseudomonas TaxID=286 RepID=UPI00041D4CC3|nr:MULTISPECIES: phosphopantetheine-binding protein [Pseudomonas]MCW2271673.1 diaminopimelate decarboxylase [Pseudomonas sp. JUb96]PRA56761.1 diaminopimelate decarboxylase [Pseudomonas sp. MYb187]
MKLSKDLVLQAKATFGTPTYLYDEAVLRSSFNELRDALPECVDIFYALKVNPNLSLVKLIRSYGGNAEVCSLAELEIALKAGVAPQDIILLGPYKKPEEHRRALEVGVFAIVVESESELRKLSVLAGELGCDAPVAIRINPNFSAAGSPWKMGGRPTHFGIEEDTAVANFGHYLALPNIRIKGIHVYNGTKILDAQSVYDNAEYILELYRSLNRRYNLDLRMVDVGGGLGIKYYENEKELDTARLKQLLAPLFNAFHHEFPRTRIILESGRFVAGKCGSLLVTVDNIKENHGKTFAVTDGGTNCHGAAAGSGQVLKRNFRIVKATGDNGGPLREYHISGPLCSPDDLLGRDVQLEALHEGDLLAVTASGAYGPTASPTLFHSHGHPAEVVVSHNRLFLARARQSAVEIRDSHADVALDELLGTVSKVMPMPIAQAATQRQLADILRVVLNLPEHVAISADSHLRDELGLDSLTSMELLVSLEDDIEGFFVNPDTITPGHFKTVASLAGYIDAHRQVPTGRRAVEAIEVHHEGV